VTCPIGQRSGGDVCGFAADLRVEISGAFSPRGAGSPTTANRRGGDI